VFFDRNLIVRTEVACLSYGLAKAGGEGAQPPMEVVLPHRSRTRMSVLPWAGALPEP
jgi:hypothetical protein